MYHHFEGAQIHEAHDALDPFLVLDNLLAFKQLSVCLYQLCHHFFNNTHGIVFIDKIEIRL